MKTFLKILVAFVVIVVILVVGGVIALGLMIDSAARTGIEEGSTYVLGVDTTLDKADVGLMSGTFSMQGLRISNPPGFDDHFLQLADAGVSIDYITIQQDVVELPTLTMRGLDMQILKNDQGTNYKIILDNLKRFESGDKSTSEPGSDAAAKKMVIKQVDIQEVKVRMQLLPAGGSLTSIPVEVDKIELHDVGSGGKPIEAGDVIPIVIKAVLGAAMAKAGELPADFQGLVGDLQSNLGGLESLGDQGITMMMDVGGQLQDVTSQVDEVVGQLGEQAQKATEGVKKAAEDVGKGLEDLGKGIGDAFKQKKGENKNDDGGG